MSEPVVAVDIGGTKIAIAVVDDGGELLAFDQQPTVPSADPDEVFAGVVTALEAVLSSPAGQQLVAEVPQLRFGISSAGPINAPAGTVSPVNILAWRDFPLVERLRTAAVAAGVSEPRIGLAGDGHCFALGEHWLGAGRGADSMIGMVLSTGVGGGAIVNGRLFAGATGNAVHLGHISVNAWGPLCVCGAYGCVERYARGPALVAAAHAAGWRGGDDAKALTDAARDGDAIARDVIEAGMRALAAGIAATATDLDVSVVVLGGGVSKAGEVIFEPLRRQLRDFAVLDFVRDLELRPAVLENAGLLGAAALAYTLD